MIIIDDEYILTVNTKPNKSYRVYASNEKQAIERFINVCKLYMKTNNQTSKDHWQDQDKAILDGDYIIFKNNDYNYVRKI